MLGCTIAHRYVIKSAPVPPDVASAAEHHARIALQPLQLRALHRRLAERGAELLLTHREQLFSERLRILAGDDLTRRERRLVQLLRKFDVERAHLLREVPV